jgi:capsular polysaccharide biosynthesis protein
MVMAMAAETMRMWLRRWWLIGLFTALGAIVGLAYALISPPEYTAKAYVAVVAEDAGDSMAVSYAQAYARIAGQGDALHAAADASDGTATVAELRRGVRASASPDAPVIELTGSAGSPERAADLVNLLADGLVTAADSHTSDTRMRLALLSAAVPPTDPTSPQLPLAVAVGAAVGLLLGGLAFLARGERSGSDRRRAERDPVGATEPDPVAATHSYLSGATRSDDGTAGQRLPTPTPTPTGRAPVTAAGAEREEMAEKVRGVAAAPRQKKDAGVEGGQDTTDEADEGDQVPDDNDGKQQSSAQRQRRRRAVASANSSRRRGAD